MHQRKHLILLLYTCQLLIVTYSGRSSKRAPVTSELVPDSGPEDSKSKGSDSEVEFVETPPKRKGPPKPR